MVRAHPHRLRNRYIETKPKEFKYLGGAPDIRITVRDETLEDLADLRELIEQGQTIPDRYYRKSTNRRGDELLIKRGIVHLHLKSHDNNALVYLIQFDDHVIMICLDTHKHLEAHPPGANLRADLISKAEVELLASLGLDPNYRPDDEDE
ncbi:MAG: hypothetical protein HQL42_15580 [Alphaproteobacteria bacterium]|nr:hypothetical protein [Alphaproteobacteria bacterium]